MKDLNKNKFYFTIENSRPFIGFKFYFDDITNVFDMEFNKEKHQLQTNLEEKIKAPLGISIDEAKNVMLEMIEKIWKRKKIIFNTFIKDKDSFLSKEGNQNKYKKTNRKFENKISFLDIVNFFGKENVNLYSSYFPKSYSEISDTIVDKLTDLYYKRYKNSFEKTEELESTRRKQSRIGRAEVKKEELSSSYIYMRYFDFIEKNFQYKGEPYQALLPLLDNLKLNFFQTEKKQDQEEYENDMKAFYENAQKSRLYFSEDISSILIPIQPKVYKSDIKVEKKLKKYVLKEWWENSKEWLEPNEKYINLYLKYITPYLKKIYSDKEKNLNDKDKKWNKYETFKIKKIDPDSLIAEDELKEEMTKIKDVLENPLLKQLFRYPYVEGRTFLKQYFEYISYVIGRICFKSSIIKMEFIEEEENYIKRFFQYTYWSKRYRFDSIFKENFKYDFGEVDFWQINEKLKNDKINKEEYEALSYLSTEEYNEIEEQLFQFNKTQMISEGGGAISILKDAKVFNGNIEENGLKELFNSSEISKTIKINLEEISKKTFKNKKALISRLLMEAKSIYNLPTPIVEKETEIEPKKIFEVEVETETNQGESEFIKEHFNNIKIEKIENFKFKPNITNSPTPVVSFSPQEIFNKILYEKFEEKMKNSIVTKKIKNINGEEFEGKFYAINVFKYNIDMIKPKIMSIVKSVLFKELIDELRPFILGERNKKGEVVKKRIKLNDLENISKIIAFKQKQISLFIEEKEIELNNELKNFNEELFKKLVKNETKKIELLFPGKENAEKRNEAFEELNSRLEKDYNSFIENKQKEFETKILNLKNDFFPKTFSETKRLAEAYSINFIIKNIRKQEQIDFIEREPVAIFLEDIHNIIKIYKPFYFRNERDKENKIIDSGKIYEKIDTKFIISQKTLRQIEKYNSLLIPINIEYILADVILKLSRTFTFAVPFIREYSKKVSDQFVTLAFFNDIENVEKFINGTVFNASNLNIVKSKYKFYLNHPEIKKEIQFLNNNKKVESKEVNYKEYLEMKYKKGLRISKKNPFDITKENITLIEGEENCWKYHRILDENIKYLYTNINSDGEIIIYSNLFSHYEEFIVQMLTLDKVLRYAWRERGKTDVDFRNYKVYNRTFDIYVKGEFLGIVKMDIESDEETYTVNNIYEKIKKILSRGSE